MHDDAMVPAVARSTWARRTLALLTVGNPSPLASRRPMHVSQDGVVALVLENCLACSQGGSALHEVSIGGERGPACKRLPTVRTASHQHAAPSSTPPANLCTHTCVTHLCDRLSAVHRSPPPSTAPPPPPTPRLRSTSSTRRSRLPTVRPQHSTSTPTAPPPHPPAFHCVHTYFWPRHSGLRPRLSRLRASSFSLRASSHNRLTIVPQLSQSSHNCLTMVLTADPILATLQVTTSSSATAL